jgi:hypothetical protein
MIPEIVFNPTAPMHQGIRWAHDCSNKSDLPLIVTRVPSGWKFYCHRCGEKGGRSTFNLSPSEYKQWQSSRNELVQENRTVKDIELPAGFTRTIPDIGLAWLYSYDLTDEDINGFGIGYSPVLNRVIMPVYNDNNELVYWQGRGLRPPYIPGKNPKYMNIKAAGRDNIYFKAQWSEEETETVVMVEDIISTIRVSHVMDTYGLLYAYIPDSLVMELASKYESIIFWLDPDKWNRMLGRVKRWRSFGINVRSIRSDQDPKFYTDDEIVDHLEV